MSNLRGNPEEIIDNVDNPHTRDEILEITGYRLQLYFPELPENQKHLVSYEKELQRTSTEFGVDNVIGGFVLTETFFGGMCQAIFVQEHALRHSSNA